MDLEAVFGILTDETTTADVSWRQHTRENAKIWLERRVADERGHGMSMWAIDNRANGEMIGLCGFFPRESQLELGYVVHARFWRRGFATEAVTAAVQNAVRAGHRIYATIRSGNHASIRVAESAGLRLSGKSEDARGELLVYGTIESQA
jgi:RimJ/RimL family protein N-acetyltransferase